MICCHRRYVLLTLLIGLTAMAFSSSPFVFGWQSQAVKVAPEGIEQISEGSVTGTISFLASDELEGRGSATPAFNIAAAYVAARFRGAGLRGGSSDGSFYHETNRRLLQTPSTPVIFSSMDSMPLEQFGLLAGGTEAYSFSGALEIVDLASDLIDVKLSGVVGGVYNSDASGPRQLAQLLRLTSSLKTAGAKALVLGVRSNSELVRLSKRMGEIPQAESSRQSFALPILLVPENVVRETTIKLEIPANIVTEIAMRNVIGILPGTDPDRSLEAVVFTAHLDGLGVRPGVGDGVFNGADDDASGVTAVLTLADAFASMSSKPKRSMIFMTYWGEELGLLGSKSFAAEPTWPLEKIVANVNIEMIGRPEPGANGKIWMTGWNESDLGFLMNQASSEFGVEIFEHPTYSRRFYRLSDNWSLVERGVIAHSFSAGSLHADYHQPDDEWDRLEIPHMTRVIQGLFVACQPLAQGLVTPKKASSK